MAARDAADDDERRDGHPPQRMGITLSTKVHLAAVRASYGHDQPKPTLGLSFLKGTAVLGKVILTVIQLV